jgi:hypothetical protein
VELGKRLADRFAQAVRGELAIVDNPRLEALFDRLAGWRSR